MVVTSWPYVGIARRSCYMGVCNVIRGKRVHPLLRPHFDVIKLKGLFQMLCSVLPCRSQMKLSFRFKHGSSTPFETIKNGTTELSSARLLSTASIEPCRTAVARLAFKRRAVVAPNSIHKLI